MSDDYDRTNPRIEPELERDDSRTREQPVAPGDVSSEDVGYQTGGTDKPFPSSPTGEFGTGGGYEPRHTDETELGASGSAAPAYGDTDSTQYIETQNPPTQVESIQYTGMGDDPGTPIATRAESASSPSTTDVAKEQGQQVGQEAVAGGQHVAGVAADEVKNVASEAGTQAKNLVGEARSQLASQASTQQNNLAAWLYDLAAELGSMANRSTAADTQSGTATQLTQQASGRAYSVASWLERHEPADALDQVTRFAQRRPGVFLALAAVGGLLAGRLTRGLTADNSSNDATRTRPATADLGVGVPDSSMRRQAYVEPDLAGPAGSGPAGVQESYVDDEAASYGEARPGAATSSADDFGLPGDVHEGGSGYLDEMNGPSDQGRR